MPRFQLLLASCAALTSSIAIAQGGRELPDRPISRAEVVAVLDQQFTAMDSDHDGKISRSEFEAYRARQNAGDAPAELAAFAHVGAHWFDRSDSDGDGVVTRAEAAARPLKMFDMADTNHDGVISLHERRLAMMMMSLGGK